MKSFYPERIVCMTEESVELLYLLGEQDRIVGVSSFVRRPPEARSKPTLSAFTHANIKKIKELKPDLVLGFSDIQKDIAKELIGAGLNVFISNQRSLNEILNYILLLGAMVGQQSKAENYVQELEERLLLYKKSWSLNKRPTVYIEEWDEPMITGIHWFSQLVDICGGDALFKDKSKGSLASERFVQSDEVVSANPDLIFACWCGKKVDKSAIQDREGWSAIKAVERNEIHELAPEIYLQPGPALFEDGLAQLSQLIKKASERLDF